MVDKIAWRKQIIELSDEDLIDELERPTSDWEKDVTRESLRRILQLLKPIKRIDKQLRADIKKSLSHGKSPRKQPDSRAWLKDKPTGFEKDDVA